MKDQYNIHEAKTHLSAILAEIQKTGKQVVISKAGEPIALLIKNPDYDNKPKKRRLGIFDGQALLADDFFTCDEEIANEIINSPLLPEERDK